MNKREALKIALIATASAASTAFGTSTASRGISRFEQCRQTIRADDCNPEQDTDMLIGFAAGLAAPNIAIRQIGRRRLILSTSVIAGIAGIAHEVFRK